MFLCSIRIIYLTGGNQNAYKPRGFDCENHCDSSFTAHLETGPEKKGVQRKIWLVPLLS